jgi:hypothetical protein
LRSFIYFVLVRGIRVLTGRGSVSQLQLENASPSPPAEGPPPAGATPGAADRDRAFLAAASRGLSRDRWGSFMVTPQTLLEGVEDHRSRIDTVVS